MFLENDKFPILISNHNSISDIFALCASKYSPSYLGKVEATKYPLFGVGAIGNYFDFYYFFKIFKFYNNMYKQIYFLGNFVFVCVI